MQRRRFLRSILSKLRGSLYESRHETHASMSFHAGTSCISGAGLSYCCVYMMLRRHEIHAGIKILCRFLSVEQWNFDFKPSLKCQYLC